MHTKSFTVRKVHIENNYYKKPHPTIFSNFAGGKTLHILIEKKFFYTNAHFI